MSSLTSLSYHFPSHSSCLPSHIPLHVHNLLLRLTTIRTKKTGTQLGDPFSMSKTTFISPKPYCFWAQPNVQYLLVPKLTGVMNYLAAEQRTQRSSSCEKSVQQRPLTSGLFQAHHLTTCIPALFLALSSTRVSLGSRFGNCLPQVVMLGLLQ